MKEENLYSAKIEITSDSSTQPGPSKTISALEFVELNMGFVKEKLKEYPLSAEYKKTYCSGLIKDFGVNMFPLLVNYEAENQAQ